MLLSIGPQRLFPFLFFLILLAGSVSPVYALNFNAFWLYRQTGAENLDARREFQQRYSLGVGPSLNLRPTHAITVNASLGYSRTQRDQGGGMTSSEVLTPAGQLSLVNDIFQVQLSGSERRRYSSKGAERWSRAWDGTLASSWDIPLWPKLRFNYGETTDSGSTANNQTSSASLSWDLLLADFNYTYNKTQLDDPDNNSLAVNETHFARLDTDGNLWNRRVRFDFAQQAQTTNQHISQGSTFTLAGDVYGKLDTVDPADFDIYVDPLDDPARIDFSAGESLDVGPNDTVHISFKSSSVSALVGPIRALRIYLDTDPGLLPLWDLYTRDPSDHWVKESDQIPGSSARDENDNFFIDIPIPTGIDKDEILLVADFILPLSITKVEADTLVNSDFSGYSNYFLTNFGLRVQFTRTLSASVNLSLEHQESEAGGGTFQNDQRLVSGSLRWTPVPYLAPSLGFSENRQEETGALDQINRSYSMSLLTIPLPTMNIVFGVTRNERYDGELKTLSSDRYSISSKAQIYPDLSADLTLGRNFSDSWDSDGLLSASDSFSSRLNLNARLIRTLTADFAVSYRTSQRDTESPDVTASPMHTSTEGADAKLSLQFRPSDLLALTGSYNTFFAGEPREDEKSMGMTLALLRTDKARFTLIATRNQAKTTSNSFILNGNWDISRMLSLRTQANYSYGETYAYSFLTTLTLRL